MKKLGYLILKGISYPMIEYKDGWVAVDQSKRPDLRINDRAAAQSPNLSLEGVMKVEIGISRYYEILATEKLGREVLISGGLKKPTDLAVQYWSEGYLYKAAQQRGMFTEEQLDKSFEAGQKWERYQFREIDFAIDLDKFKDSLLPKYEVESFENGETVTKAKLV